MPSFLRGRSGQFVIAVSLMTVGFWISRTAWAGTVSQAKIVGIGMATGSGSVLVEMSKPLDNRAGCVSVEFPSAFALAINTERGRAILSLLTSALVAGKTVNILGSGTCSAVSSWTGTGGRAENVVSVSVAGT